MQQFNSVTETLEILNISRPSLYRRIKEGNVPAVRIGGRLLIPSVFFDELRNRAFNRAPQMAVE